MILTITGIKAQVPLMNNVTINVSARVVSESPVELTTLNNLIISGYGNGADDIYISPISSTEAGLMEVKGTPGAQIRLSYIMTEELVEENGGGRITLNYKMSSNPEKVQSSSKLIDTGEAILNLDDNGLYYLWVGARVDLSKALHGKYIGQFTIEIQYI